MTNPFLCAGSTPQANLVPILPFSNAPLGPKAISIACSRYTATWLPLRPHLRRYG